MTKYIDELEESVLNDDTKIINLDFLIRTTPMEGFYVLIGDKFLFMNKSDMLDYIINEYFKKNNDLFYISQAFILDVKYHGNSVLLIKGGMSRITRYDYNGVYGEEFMELREFIIKIYTNR